MGTGSQYDSTNDTASYSSINHKTRLIDTGTNNVAATKVGAGQECYATTTSAGQIKGTDYILDPTGTIWTNKLSNLHWITKHGAVIPVNATAANNLTGLLTGITATGTLGVAALDTTDGLALTFTSGASAGNQSGLNRAILYTIRNFNPCFKLRWKTDEAGSNVRFFAGWTSSTALIANSDDGLNTLSGFGIAMDTTQANYRIWSNDGVGATTAADTGIAKDTNFHTFEAWADDNAAAFYWSLDGSTPASVSAQIPATTTSLSCQFEVTAVNADAKLLSVLKCLVTSDK